MNNRKGWMGRTAVVAVFIAMFLEMTSPPATATFPGANGPIAYTHSTAHGYEVCLINPDGSGRRCLTHNRVDDFEPAFSPDGSKIAWAHGRIGHSTIWLMRLDGTHKRQVTALG